MNAVSKRISLAVEHLKEAGINDCVMAFEAINESGGVQPYVIRIGSPMACLGLAEFAADYLGSIRDSGIYPGEYEEDEYDED